MRSHDLQWLAYARFRRALDNDNLLAARAAATDLKHVGLAEALELTLLILAKEPPRFRAVALRWHAATAATTRSRSRRRPPCSGSSPCSKAVGLSLRPKLLRAFSTAARSCQPLRR
jgi:hypothetical protein